MSPSINLNDLAHSEFKSLFNSIKFVLSDNDGVLSLFGDLLPGVSESINIMRKNGKSVKIITNNTVFDSKVLSAIFAKQGLKCSPSDIITPTSAMIDYLKKRKFQGKLWLNGYEQQEELFREAGFKIAETEAPKIMSLQEARKSFSCLDPEIKAIIVEINFNMTYQNIAKAVKYLNSNKDILYIVGGTDASVPIGKDELIIGPHYIQKIISDSARNPIILGKPSKYFGMFLIETLKCKPEETLFIGDSLEHDIGFAKQMGFQQLLVLTGQTKLEQLNNCLELHQPKYYISSMEEFNDLLVKHLS